MKKKAIVMAVSLAVLLTTLVLTQAVSAKPSTVTGHVTALDSYDNGHANVTLDTNGDGDGDWAMDLYMNQDQYNDIRNAKRDGKKVKITYQLEGGNYTVMGVQILNNVNSYTKTELFDDEKELIPELVLIGEGRVEMDDGVSGIQ